MACVRFWRVSTRSSKAGKASTSACMAIWLLGVPVTALMWSSSNETEGERSSDRRGRSGAGGGVFAVGGAELIAGAGFMVFWVIPCYPRDYHRGRLFYGVYEEAPPTKRNPIITENIQCAPKLFFKGSPEGNPPGGGCPPFWGALEATIGRF